MAEGAAKLMPPAPLATPVFRALWIATVISNIGTWMHEVGAAWLMTELSSSPLMVAFVQAAATLPIFLLALPSGALADIVDRRRMLLAAQMFSLAAAAGLAASTFIGLTSPWALLGFTFLLGAGAAASAPAFQAIVPELVQPRALPEAVALNSLGTNIARAVGPALGGVIVALSGPPAVFAVNALSVLGVLAVLARWRREPATGVLPPERFHHAVRSGVRYARRSPAMQLVLIRAGGFLLFASATWAMLPLIARAGLTPNALSALATLLFAAAGVVLVATRSAAVAGAAVFAAGVAWITIVSSLNVAAQSASPAWVKARALSLYLVVFQGAMTAGSLLWGLAASRFGLQAAVLTAGLGLAGATTLALRFPLPGQAVNDLTPSGHWPDPALAGQLDEDRGPVMVTITYRIEAGKVGAFVRAMRDLRRMRLRDGAIRWDLFEDAARPGLMVEAFVVESWLEHQRQHRRVTEADRIEQDAIARFHTGRKPPEVRHLLTP